MLGRAGGRVGITRGLRCRPVQLDWVVSAKHGVLCSHRGLLYPHCDNLPSVAALIDASVSPPSECMMTQLFLFLSGGGGRTKNRPSYS